MNWLISANSNIYDHASSFEHYGYIDWRQVKYKYKIEDIVYIYCTRPLKKIRYKCKVSKIDMNFNEIRDDKEYWNSISEYHKSKNGKFMRLNLINQVDNELLSYKNLLSNGLKVAPQGAKKLYGELLVYIDTNFNDKKQNENFPEEISLNQDIYEGLKKQIYVNKYERSSVARAKCIEYHGCMCSICGMNFKSKYGEVGDGFIHVHHIIPINKIDAEYKIDYKNDLIPVCPNCHSMLHRRIKGKEITINELKKVLKYI